MKPVIVKGVIDLKKYQHVEKTKDKEKGVDVFNPMYTHLDKNDNPCGIMVNRGWLPFDLKDIRYDHD